MLWWLIVLSILVLYLLWKVYQITVWLKDFMKRLNTHLSVDCGCGAGGTWPPPEPPDWP
jgi:hypothetical protein